MKILEIFKNVLSKVKLNGLMLVTIVIGFYWFQGRIDELKRIQERVELNVSQIKYEDGSISSSVEVVSDQDLEEMKGELVKDLKDLERVLKNSQIESITRLKVELKDEIKRVSVYTGIDEESGEQIATFTDPFFELKVLKETFEPISVKHAPIKIELIRTEESFRSKLYAVVKNTWSDQVIDQVEVEQFFNEDLVEDRAYWFGVGALNTSFFVTLDRVERKTSWGVMAGYDLQNRSYQIGLTRKWKLWF